jgi:prepilin-type N-terminal cleavage/methylation domain-containing protein
MRSSHRVDGFSLIELVVSTAVLGLLLASFGVFYRSQVIALSNQERYLNAKQSAQIGLDFMMRELRTAGSRPMYESFPGCGVAASTSNVCFGFLGQKGFPSLVSANATSLRLLADYRGDAAGAPADGCPNDPEEDVTYTYDAANGRLLRRSGAAGAPATVLNGIAPGGFAIQYYGHGTGTPPPFVPFTGSLTADQIARLTHVVIRVTTRAPSRIASAPAIVSTQTSTIDIRNPAC